MSGSAMTSSPSSAERHPLEIYADSYAQMARMDDGRVDCRSVEVDIRQNMIPVTVAATALSVIQAERDGAREYGKQARLRENAAEDARVSAIDRASRAEAALASREYPAVKALEWHASVFRENSWLAPNGFGENYVAYRYEGKWRCMGQDWPSLDAAKGAAQADYEARTRSALASPSDREATPIPCHHCGSLVVPPSDREAVTVTELKRQIAQTMDDLLVNDDGAVPWAHVANARDEIVRIVTAALALSAPGMVEVPREHTDAVIRAGKMLANAAYNIHQRAADIYVGFGLDDAIRSMKSAQEEWDRALAASPSQTKGAEQ